MSDIHALLKGSSFVLIFSIISNFAGMSSRIVLANGYTPAVFGRIMIGYTLFGMLGIFAIWSVDTGVTYYISGIDDSENEWNILSAAIGVGLIITITFTAPFFIFKSQIATTLFRSPEVEPFLLPFLLAIPIFMIFQIVVGYFRGVEHVLYKGLSKDIVYNVSQLLLISGFMWMGIDGTMIGFVYVLSSALALVTSLYFLQGMVSTSIYEVKASNILPWSKSILRYSTPLVLLSFSMWGMNYIDTFLIQALGSSEGVGLYKSVYPLALSLITILGSFGFLYLPIVSRLQSEDDMEKIIQLYSTATFVPFAITLPLFMMFMFFPESVISVLYSSTYLPAAPALQWLSVAFLFPVIFGLNNASLNAVNRTTANATLTGISFVINLSLNILLIPPYGLVGAAVATAASSFIWNLLTSSWLFYTEDIHPFMNYYLIGLLITSLSTAGLFYCYRWTVQPISAMDFPFQFIALLIPLVLSTILNGIILINTIPKDVATDVDIISYFLRLRIVD
jgi:O-antigen/teichoic acid export membrane protein